MGTAGTSRTGLLLRWSLRDLRQRWIQVGALSMVVALAVGTWAGMGGTAQWRRESNDRSFAALNVHDVRIDLTTGSLVAEGLLFDAVSTINNPERIRQVEERLLLPTQVEAEGDTGTVQAPGEILGVPVTAADGPTIDALEIRAGEGLEPAGSAVAVDVHFADQHGLATAGNINLSGGISVPYRGHALSPEHFLVLNRQGGIFAAASYAVVFAPLETLQELTGRQGQVNQVVLTAADGLTPAEQTILADDLSSALARELPGVGVTITPLEEEPVFRLLYDDIDNDQRFYNIFAGLIFAGATFGAFNLARRLVESQRRELGIAMALGAPSPAIAVRPLLVGLELAIAGTALGVAVGVLIAEAMKSLFEGLLPLPVWETSLDAGAFARAAAVGVAVPLVGVGWPVIRALRVKPVETMTPTYRSAAHRVVPRFGRRFRLPGTSLTMVPIRNVLRSLQRTGLTVAAIAAAIGALVAVLGMLDSFANTIDRGEATALAGNPSRITVDFEQVMAVDAAPMMAVVGDRTVADWEPVLRLPAELHQLDGETSIDVLLEARDLDSSIWRPNLDRSVTVGEPGLIVAAKAASDLGLEVGDSVRLHHPVRRGQDSFATTDTTIAIVALHDIPLRTTAFIDAGHGELFNMAGLANSLDVIPPPGTERTEVKAALFSVPGVAAIQGVSETAEVFRDLIDDFLDVLLIVEGIAVALTLLVAVNATSINVEERRREHATMRAFGLPLPRIVWLMVAENALLGLVGALSGVGLGALLVRWIISFSVSETVPDLDVTASVSSQSLLIGLAVGTATVALAPLLSVRRLRRTDLPAALRIVE